MDNIFKNAKRHLGQNFLVDARVRERIIQAAEISPGEVILEIGPGRGDLTESLIAAGAVVYAVEKDTALVPRLRQRIPDERLQVMTGDFLKISIPEIPTVDKVVGNIPYNISTPIIEKLIDERAVLRHIFLTVQREFARRLIAEPGTKDYGALTCFVRYFYDVREHFLIHPQSFRPVPRVTSSFIELSYRDPVVRARDERLLFKITRMAFSRRRKTLVNALVETVSREKLKTVLAEMNLDERVRPEELSLSEYVRLADALAF